MQLVIILQKCGISLSIQEIYRNNANSFCFMPYNILPVCESRSGCRRPRRVSAAAHTVLLNYVALPSQLRFVLNALLHVLYGRCLGAGITWKRAFKFPILVWPVRYTPAL